MYMHLGEFDVIFEKNEFRKYREPVVVFTRRRKSHASVPLRL
jgi:hypothetical protein